MDEYRDNILLQISTELILMFFLSFVVLFFFRKIAQKIDLVDRPSGRKNHEGAVPLVGGISVGVTFLYYLLLNPTSVPYSYHFAASIALLLIVGALDDKFDISFKIRFVVQGALALAMMYFADVKLHSLGNILGFGDIHLGWVGYLITIFAVVGAINAFNMVDGIDGLLGGLSMVTFGSISMLLFSEGRSTTAYVALLIVVIMLPYVLFNLGVFGRQYKIFMGDAGSMMIGFMVVWLLLCTSQISPEPLIRPVTALWFIAIPLMDMAAIMIRRIRRGDSPFKPDREHLHHIFQRLGLSPTQTLLAICGLAALFAGFGFYGEVMQISEAVMFYAFLALFGVYALLLSYVWKVTAKLRAWFNLETHTNDPELSANKGNYKSSL
ncbi:UDP-N-acetylglucosamine--undecaprenyl-phosphate N-acetylglucosaminephosphotransferase [Vibrio gangliei]|uniref:UDP-N-acetylglucosamine--undecaprenyl-phosphate N-acetylglucosaminephosphotransferase n=1 Tax=Vibrio gangliei TaxID=2077090 RepID=UPI001B802FE1|nr:UDP-N-acetylglucosamine--undecaprenyl-phosphate N-acetylglucosaminephosphotransferase [Vibrio gangliei]